VRKRPLSLKGAAHAHAASAKAAAVKDAPAVPKPPAWPANDSPSAATVQWNSHGLRIEASNSSLEQILKDVATATGARIEGLDADQRIFGAYGPGTARDILSQLLDGLGYNVLMIGDQGQGTPREVVLSPQSASNAHAAAADSQTAQSDESANAAEQPQEEPPPEMRNGLAPGAPPRTPQEIMQEMQQRQEQQEQQQNANPRF
jgi:hypothetical protein